MIVNYFYWQQNRHFRVDEAIKRATRLATEWILENGFGNVLVDINNKNTGFSSTHSTLSA